MIVVSFLSKKVYVTCVLTVALLAQDAAIRTNVHLVLVPATVTSRRGDLIDGLTADDFIVTDDGVPQKVRLDTSDTVLAPVSLVVLVQASGISAPALARIRQVGPMMQPLVVGDRGQAAVFAYDDEVRKYQDFTGDGTNIRKAFEEIQPRTIKQAKLIDAVIEGMKMLATRPENYRRIMLVMGESRDRGSKHKLAEAVELAQRAGVVIYFLTYSAEGQAWTSSADDDPSMPGDADYIGAIKEVSRLATKNDANAFARTTGGRHLSFLTEKSLEAAIARLGQEVHSQYLLSFVPTDTKNTGMHRIQVKLAKFPTVVVRARPAYWPER